MIDELDYIDLNEINIADDVIKRFDCGNKDINEYFYETSKDDCKTGNAVTYILVNKDDIENKNIDNIYAVATIKTTGLNYFEPGEKYHTKKLMKTEMFFRLFLV